MTAPQDATLDALLDEFADAVEVRARADFMGLNNYSKHKLPHARAALVAHFAASAQTAAGMIVDNATVTEAQRLTGWLPAGDKDCAAWVSSAAALLEKIAAPAQQPAAPLVAMPEIPPGYALMTQADFDRALAALRQQSPANPAKVETVAEGQLQRIADKLRELCDTVLRGQAASDVREVWRELFNAIANPTTGARTAKSEPANRTAMPEGRMRSALQWVRGIATLLGGGVQQVEEHMAALEEAVAAYDPAKAVGWQPIETAPRTGIAVLLWQPWKSGRDCSVIGHYANGWADRDNEGMQPEPTHWMPLPSPPVVQESPK